MKRCHKCGTEWVSEKRQPGFKEYCEQCSAYLHCCLNCRFHEKARHNQCQIPNTDWVGNREGCNFCEDFEFADTEVDTGKGRVEDQARDAFHGLFGGEGGAGDDKTPSPDDFDKLFGD